MCENPRRMQRDTCRTCGANTELGPDGFLKSHWVPDTRDLCEGRPGQTNPDLEAAWAAYAAKMDERIKLINEWRYSFEPPAFVIRDLEILYRECTELLVTYFELFDADQRERFPDTETSRTCWILAA